jgi:tetratricopeptide (TPR) repeat protein
MKRIIAVLVAALLAVSAAAALEGAIDRENMSLKAGPTEPGESLSLVWVEALVYPNVVRDERIVSLGVRTASPIKTVKALFDFSPTPVNLTSNDGLTWSTAYKIPDQAAPGVHVARYQISGQKGSIQRSVEFFVEKITAGNQASEVSRGEAFQSSGWPISINATCTAYSLDSNRILYPGQILTSISKMPWYKVVFEDGKEGWVSAASVKEPTDDYCQLGAEAAKAGKHAIAIKYFQNALAVDPQLVKGYAGLARSYAATGQDEAAAEAVKKALRLDERDIESRVLASELAETYLASGRQKAQAKRWQEASIQFRQAVELRPEKAEAWIELGNSLAALGLTQAARETWITGLKYEPFNDNLRAKLGGESLAVASRPERSRPADLAAKPRPQVAPLIANDSVQILKAGKTNKGTKIESALRSVVTMTKSLGTPIVEKGWQVKRQGEKFLVSFLCEQSGGALESFDWLVDVDTRQVLPHNDNARLLMGRW